MSDIKGVGMCGRLALTGDPAAVRAYFRYAEQPNFPPRANISPTQPVGIVRMGAGPAETAPRHFTLVRWGFLPGFVKDPKHFPLVINARAETAAEKPSFRHALARRRCFFVADAYYEWQRAPGPKTKKRPPPRPFLFRRADGMPLALAGLWEAWVGPNGEEMDTACILTCAANGPVSAIHDRMPVILEPEDFDLWLASANHTTLEDASKLMRPAGDDVLEFFEIGPAINKAGHEGPDLQAPVAASLGHLL